MLNHQIDDDRYEAHFENWAGGMLYIESNPEAYQNWHSWFCKYRNRCMDLSVLTYQDFEDLETFFGLMYNPSGKNELHYIKDLCADYINGMINNRRLVYSTDSTEGEF
jgi:hypothetical protein